jgi:hypothetical protein
MLGTVPMVKRCEARHGHADVAMAADPRFRGRLSGRVAPQFPGPDHIIATLKY